MLIVSRVFSRKDGGLVDARYRGHQLRVAADSTVFVQPSAGVGMPQPATGEYDARNGTRVLTQYRGRAVSSSRDGTLFVQRKGVI